jgi:hypothetical protein
MIPGCPDLLQAKGKYNMTYSSMLNVALLNFLFLAGCTGDQTGKSINDYLMPMQEFSRISGVEVVQKIESLDDYDFQKEGKPKEYGQSLINAGVKQIYKILYAIDRTDRTKAVIGEIYVYETNQQAVDHLTRLVSSGLNGDYVEVDGIGDKAFQYRRESVSFVKDKVGVALTIINNDVDIHEFASKYANWLETG